MWNVEPKETKQQQKNLWTNPKLTTRNEEIRIRQLIYIKIFIYPVCVCVNSAQCRVWFSSRDKWNKKFRIYCFDMIFFFKKKRKIISQFSKTKGTIIHSNVVYFLVFCVVIMCLYYCLKFKEKYSFAKSGISFKWEIVCVCVRTLRFKFNSKIAQFLFNWNMSMLFCWNNNKFSFFSD